MQHVDTHMQRFGYNAQLAMCLHIRLYVCMLSYICIKVIHTYQSHTYVSKSYIRIKVIHTYQSHTYVSKSYIRIKVIHMYQSIQTAKSDLCDKTEPGVTLCNMHSSINNQTFVFKSKSLHYMPTIHSKTRFISKASVRLQVGYCDDQNRKSMSGSGE